MAIRSTIIQRIKDYCWRYASMFLRGIIEPSACVTEAKQRRRLRLLSIFLLIIAIWTMIGMLDMMAIGNSLWSIMAVTGTALIILYGLSRTRYYKLATVFAVIVPAVPSFSEIFFGNHVQDITTPMMWLALPLLVTGVLLSLRHTIIVAISYNIAIAFLIPLAGLPPSSMIQILPFISIMSMIVIAIAAVRQQDQSEIEHQLTERMAADEALREREKRFSDIAENALEWIWEVDTKGKYTYSSPVVEQILGYKPEEILGKYFYDFFHPEDKEEMKKAAFEAFSQKLPFHGFINRNVKKNGEIVILSTSGVPVIDEAGNLIGYRGVDTDITKRMRAEEALRESEEKFSKAFRTSPNTMAITTLEDGRFIDVNDSHTRITGYTWEETIGHNAVELGLWASAEERARMVQILEEQGSVQNEEFIFRMKNGEFRNWLFSAEPINLHGEKCIISVTTDITERKRAEEALADEATRRRILMEQSKDGIVIIDQNGKVYEANQRFAEILGYSSEEVLQLHVWDWDTQWTQEQVLENIRSVDEVDDHLETRHRRKDGSTYDVEISTNGAMFAGQKLIFCVCRDITERKQAEEALREREKRFSDIAENALEWIWEVDTKGKYTYSSPVVEQILGYKPEEILGKYFYDFFHPEDKEEMKKAAFEAFSQKQPFHEFINRNVKRNGEIIILSTSGVPVIDEAGNLIGYRGVDTDITKRMRAEEALRESEEKFSKAFRSSPDAIAITTIKDGKFIEVNDSYTRITGYTREEVIGHSSSEFGAWARKGERNRIIRTLKEQGRVSNEEVHLHAKSGKIMICLFSAELISIGGEPCMISLATDITRRKQAEEELKQALINLERSSAQLTATNKELEAFSYSVSHDLRSPLRSIDGFSQALLEDYMDKLDEEGQDYLSRLRSASQKMGELIDGLLKLSRLTRSEMHREKVDLSALAKEITARLKETQPERRVDFIIGRGLTVSGDRQLLRVLMENLLGNAWKFTSKREQAKIEFGATQNGDKKAYFIKDNGAGFDMTYAKRLFSAFQRLHETTEFSGTGIGLATVQRIINRHGGSVWAEGAQEKGATFYFTLN